MQTWQDFKNLDCLKTGSDETKFTGVLTKKLQYNIWLKAITYFNTANDNAIENCHMNQILSILFTLLSEFGFISRLTFPVVIFVVDLANMFDEQIRRLLSISYNSYSY